jgi:hypothetical protein
MLEWLRDPAWQGVGVLASWLIGIYQAIKGRSKVWIYIASAITLLFLGFLLGMATTELDSKKSFEVNVTRAANLFSTLTPITITSLQFIPPHMLPIQGTYKDIPENSEIWVYVQANDNQFYITETRKEDEKTWTSSLARLGDGGKFGKTYKVGLLLGDSRNCKELRNKKGLIALPACATKFGEITIQIDSLN